MLAAAYVKVYARYGQEAGGRVEFLKDGYTDRAGRFDYFTLTSTPAGKVSKLAVLVAHPQAGALSQEVAPPAH